MDKIKKYAAGVLSAFLMVTTLTGCSANDRSDAQEAAESFLAAVQKGDENSINNYASSQVASGNFVNLFDVNALRQQFREGYGENDMEDETAAKLDEFCDLFSSLITSYEVNEVTIDNSGVATAISTVETKFPIDITSSEEASTLISQLTENYYTQHQDEIASLIEDEGEEAATKQIYNIMTREVLDVYIGLIEASDPDSYAIVLSLQKNPETGSWYVSNIQDYDSSINGTFAPATDTATTELSTVDADAALESASNATTDN